jgi:hypothetical protein
MADTETAQEQSKQTQATTNHNYKRIKNNQHNDE